jgi:hypothetical protein
MAASSPMADEKHFTVQLDTVIAASMLLGHPLGDRFHVRNAQSRDLGRHFRQVSKTELRAPSQRNSFACAPVDLLMSRGENGLEFHLLEFNGTGIGGISSLPGPVVACFLDSLREMATQVSDPEGVVLLGISGQESASNPRRNGQMHEKMLFAEALTRGLQQRHGTAWISSVPLLLHDPRETTRRQGPVVVMGYMKSFLEHLRLDANGRLTLLGRRVSGVLNDRFLLNVVQRFGADLDTTGLIALNRTYLPGGNKSVAYELIHEHLANEPFPYMPENVSYETAHTREALIEVVQRWKHFHKRFVIKPHATGAGHGIEFFLDPSESDDEVIAKIDGSLRTTEVYYGLTGGALPYTVCPFVDACCINRPGHDLHGHKFELRVVVYRDGDALHAYPSIIKVASTPWDPAAKTRASLINNITAATEQARRAEDYVLPFCNPDTLALLGLSVGEVGDLCRFLARYARHVLDRIEDEPRRYTIDAPAPLTLK